MECLADVLINAGIATADQRENLLNSADYQINYQGKTYPLMAEENGKVSPQSAPAVRLRTCQIFLEPLADEQYQLSVALIVDGDYPDETMAQLYSWAEDAAKASDMTLSKSTTALVWRVPLLFSAKGDLKTVSQHLGKLLGDPNLSIEFSDLPPGVDTKKSASGTGADRNNQKNHPDFDERWTHTRYLSVKIHPTLFDVDSENQKPNLLVHYLGGAGMLYLEQPENTTASQDSAAGLLSRGQSLDTVSRSLSASLGDLFKPQIGGNNYCATLNLSDDKSKNTAVLRIDNTLPIHSLEVITDFKPDGLIRREFNFTIARSDAERLYAERDRIQYKDLKIEMADVPDKPDQRVLRHIFESKDMNDTNYVSSLILSEDFGGVFAQADASHQQYAIHLAPPAHIIGQIPQVSYELRTDAEIRFINPKLTQMRGDESNAESFRNLSNPLDENGKPHTGRIFDEKIWDLTRAPSKDELKVLKDAEADYPYMDIEPQRVVINYNDAPQNPDLHFEFLIQSDQSGRIVLPIVIGVLVLALVAVLVIVLIRRKRKPQETSPASAKN